MTEAADLPVNNAMVLGVSLGVSSLGGEQTWRWNSLGMNYPRDGLSLGWIIVFLNYRRGQLSYEMKFPGGGKFFHDGDEFSGGEWRKDVCTSLFVRLPNVLKCSLKRV